MRFVTSGRRFELSQNNHAGDCGTVKYQSTRGEAPVLEFSDVLLAGLAVDGGLYVPVEFPKLTSSDLRSLSEMSYSEVATRVLEPFVSPSIGVDELGNMIEDSYSTFRHPDVVPVKQLPAEIGDDRYMAELYWGPTFSFKDVALQLLGRLFEYELSQRNAGVTIVGATSGDTGSAAIEACKDRSGIELVMLHPRGRVSEVQRRQMTTIASPNIHNIAIDGTFDDCQDLVKAMFSDLQFRERHKLAAVNSINWARVAAQTVYYFTTATRMAGPNQPISFCVPTGNFGNILAGYIASRMGLPINRLIIASNHNDILTRTYSSGVMEIQEVEPSTSPAMDIQVSSNFERLLFDLGEKDSVGLAAAMRDFRSTGSMKLQKSVIERMRDAFDAGRASEAEVEQEILDLYLTQEEFLDPHTAVGIHVLREMKSLDGPTAVMATAHPAKFNTVVEAATGTAPPQPVEIAGLMERTERCVDLPNELSAVMDFVSSASTI